MPRVDRVLVSECVIVCVGCQGGCSSKEAVTPAGTPMPSPHRGTAALFALDYIVVVNLPCADTVHPSPSSTFGSALSTTTNHVQPTIFRGVSPSCMLTTGRQPLAVCQVMARHQRVSQLRRTRLSQ